MNDKNQDHQGSHGGASAICFGLDRPTDERSLQLFLQNFAEPAVLEVLIPRLNDSEIEAAIDFLTGLLRRHLSKEEYHRLFLKD
ncbi:MAG: hypothetical protein P8Y63_06080 [Deltaproteobacteria bacterium]|jgi:hypothetical protein